MNSLVNRNHALNVQNSSRTTCHVVQIHSPLWRLQLVREKPTRSLVQRSDKRFSRYLVMDVKSFKICTSYHMVDNNADNRICWYQLLCNCTLFLLIFARTKFRDFCVFEKKHSLFHGDDRESERAKKRKRSWLAHSFNRPHWPRAWSRLEKKRNAHVNKKKKKYMDFKCCETQAGW